MPTFQLARQFHASCVRALALLLPLTIAACGGGGHGSTQDPTAQGEPAAQSLSPTDLRLTAYVGRWAGPCEAIYTTQTIIPTTTVQMGEVTVEVPGDPYTISVNTGTTEQDFAEFSIARSGVLAMTSVHRIYNNTTCSGTPEQEPAIRSLEARHTGTKEISGRVADKFEVEPSSPPERMLLLIDGNRLHEGSDIFSRDLDGYQNWVDFTQYLERLNTTP